MNKFCIIVNKDRDEHLELTGRVQDFLAAQGKQFAVRMESLDTADAEWKPIPEDVDCIIVLGGDGTMIRAANRLLKYDIPIFGINAGNLGYLTGVEARDAEKGLDYLKASADHGNTYAAELLRSIQYQQTRGVTMAANSLLAQLGRLFQENQQKQEQSQRIRTDRKYRRQIDEKKQALGIRD